jgi:uncharacterized membrane protein
MENFRARIKKFTSSRLTPLDKFETASCFLISVSLINAIYWLADRKLQLAPGIAVFIILYVCSMICLSVFKKKLESRKKE